MKETTFIVTTIGSGIGGILGGAILSWFAFTHFYQKQKGEKISLPPQQVKSAQLVRQIDNVQQQPQPKENVGLSPQQVRAINQVKGTTGGGVQKLKKRKSPNFRKLK